ncbi:MAG: methylmalonyl Co-A mutase-associated GTPase MeaB [Flavobacteriales bacterium]|jgi:LAO/AO transport system kinase
MSNARNKAASKALDRIKHKQRLQDANFYFEGIRNGSIGLLAEAITLVESTKPEHRKLSEEILQKCLPFAGNSIRLGITGVPGVGKSTFIESFGAFLTQQKHRVAVLAIDPSSPITKGSILGDKTRMELLSQNANAFIRPSPAADSLGGVARKTKESLLLCETAGFDFIIIETVGVGQSETAVHQMTDFFLLLMLAGAGDQLQGIKRGIMEMCDALIITKADGENEKKAMRAKAEYTSALHFYPAKTSGWIPKVSSCSALENKGIEDVYAIVQEHHRWFKERGLLQQLRDQQDVLWMEDNIKDRILSKYFENPEFQSKLKAVRQELSEKKITPFQAAERMFGL